jgi:hypothetical protein
MRTVKTMAVTTRMTIKGRDTEVKVMAMPTREMLAPVPEVTVTDPIERIGHILAQSVIRVVNRDHHRVQVEKTPELPWCME